MEGSTKVQAHNVQQQDNASRNIAFSVGERVEAIWSSDGQKYPGRIVHVFQNDVYDVVFDDGVKSRRKSNLIFKLDPTQRIEASEFALLPRIRQGRPAGENMMIRTPSLLSLKSKPPFNPSTSSSSSQIPPPPPLLCGITNTRKSSVDIDSNDDNLSKGTTVIDSSTPILTKPPKIKRRIGRPPLLTPKPSSVINSNVSNNDVKPKVSVSRNGEDHDQELSTTPSASVNEEGMVNVIINTNGSSSPLTINTSNSDGGTKCLENNTNSIWNLTSPVANPNSPQNASTKKGFVYVQQPHYSVFDPPPVDLGKRQRRVHNYSKLAKGPSLKMNLSANSNGLEELIDGEYTPTSTPSSSKPNSRCSSPNIVSATLINNVNSSTTPRLLSSTSQSMSSVSLSSKKATAKPPHLKVSSLPTPTPGSSGGSRFVRKRRFLKSPTKSSPTDTDTDKKVPTSSTSFELASINPFDGTDASPASLIKDTPVTIASQAQAPEVSTERSVEVVVTPPPIITDPPPTVKPKPPKTTPSSPTKKSTSSNRDNKAKAHAVEVMAPPLPPPTQQRDSSEGEVIPTKRLRKPSLRCAEEGYVDIFSQRRTRRSSPSTPQPKNKSSTESEFKIPTTSPPKSHKRKGRKPKAMSVSADPIQSELLPVSKISTSTSGFLPLVPPNCDVSHSKGLSKTIKPHKLPQNEGETSDDELLDIGEYTVAQPAASITKSRSKSPNKKPPRPRQASSSSPQDDTRESNTVPLSSIAEKEVSMESPSEKEVQPIETVAGNNLVQQRPLRQTSRGRIVRPPVLKTETLKESTVVLDRMAIPKVQVLVEKCDSVISVNQSTHISVVGKIPKHKLVTQKGVSSSTSASTSASRDDGQMEVAVDDAPVTSSLYGKSSKQLKNKKRWNKGRGLLPGIKSGMRVNDSHAMQLLKRSRLQRRFDNRGRPKVVLLKGISKKRLKKIQESLKKRKLKRKKISVITKFKDVRVDIINCICGRTDEFGLMVQCEVCMCWQHGNCFGYFDGSTLPRFYVCQSCASPKRVRRSYKTEGIRQEIYKKGILPSYPFAPKSSLVQQKILKRCNDLTKMVNSIENSIRQNRLKELIATSEPEHKKLYQWSTPRAHPKDLIQKWQFNKYYKPVLRRLIIRNKGKPDYMEKLANIVAFRDKLKKYSQAFDEAKLAISRKIGSRGLILVEKLSEQESKLTKIHKVKNKLDSELSLMPETMRNSLLSQMLDTHLPHKSLNEHSSFSSNESDPLINKIATTSMIEEFIAKFGGLFDSYDSDDDQSGSNVEDDTFTSLLTEPDRKTHDENRSEKTDEVYIKQEPDDGPNFTVTNNENAELAEEIIRFNLEQLQDQNIPILADEESDNWVEMKRRSSSSTSNDGDMIKLMLSKHKPALGIDLTTSTAVTLVDIESESEDILSGDTTVSVEDSEGGEEYWYNPITELNCEYDAMRKLLLHDRLVEYDKKSDGLWNPSRESRTLKRDWIDDLDFYLNGDLGLGLDSISDSGDSSASSSETESEDEVDAENGDGSTDVVDNDECKSEISAGEEQMDFEETPSHSRYWQKAVTEVDNSQDEDDEDWNAEDISNSEESSEDEDDRTTKSHKTVKFDPSTSQHNSETQTPEVNDMMFVTSDFDANPGEIIDVRLLIENKSVVRKALVIGGARGENFVKLLDDNKDKRDEDFIMSNFGNTSPTQLLLCKPCQESLGVKWTWKQLNSAKGVNIVLDDTIQTLATEVERCKQLGLSTLDVKAAFDLHQLANFKSSSFFTESSEHKFLAPAPRTLYEPRKLTEMCRDVLSKPRSSRSRKHFSSNSPSFCKPQPASAEEESILTLLSLSKAPVDCNGDNVSELSIESLRKLTDRLQHNGPLSEDLAKAVTGPLTNGKIGLQLDKLSSKPLDVEPICVRCKLQQENAQRLYILITHNPSLVNSKENKKKLQQWCSRMSQAVEDIRLSTHATRSILYYKVQVLAQRKRAEKTARDLGVKITPDSMRRRLQIAKPDHYLSQLKAEFVDALMPYATYFISRFTKKDDVSTAKKSWIGAMIRNYNNVKKTLQSMFSVENEEGRLQSEDKFYAALDNLRKSFDIVLTKKDIKMRRQNQSFSQSESIPQSEIGESPNVKFPSLSIAEDENKNKVEEPESIVSNSNTPLVNGLNCNESETFSAKHESADNSNQTSQDGIGDTPSLQPVPDSNPQTQPVMESTPKLEQNNVETLPIPTTRQLQELEIFTRLANYPIPVEDVNAFLGIANEAVSGQLDNSNNSEENQSIPTSAESTGQLNTINTTASESPLELDDFRLIEENLSSSGNLVLGGDMDLMNTIGSLGATFKGTEESDLLLNVFDDPIFSGPPEEPVPCSSRNIARQPQPAHISAAPSLAKLTPEMCKGFLLDDIRAHQQVIDSQLDKLESEIIDLERRRGNGLKDKDDHKLFEMLYANMQILLENTDVLHELTRNSVGLDNEKMIVEMQAEVAEMDVIEEEMKQEKNTCGFSPDRSSDSEYEDMFYPKS